MMKGNTVDKREIEKFSSLSDKWWDPLGEFKPLHEINPIRIDFIRKHVQGYYNIKEKADILHGLDFLDIGCGGGLLSEPLARLGGRVTAIDPSEKNIQIAKFHAEKVGLDIDYRVKSVESLSLEGRKFDVVVNMEVVEHVADVDLFLEKSCHLVKENGLMFLSTLNRTCKSYLLSIIGAEYILRWLPRGTHQWQKFLHPHEIERKFRRNSFQIIEYKGINFDLSSREWRVTENLDVNYLVVAKKC